MGENADADRRHSWPYTGDTESLLLTVLRADFM